MTGKQTAVVWMGLILVALNIFTGDTWKQIKSVLFAAPSKSSGSGSGKSPTIPNPLTPLKPLLPLIPISTPGTATTSNTPTSA